MSADHASRPGEFTVRAATPADVPAVWDLMRDFAGFVRQQHLVTGSAEQLQAHLFGDAWPRVECRVAESGGRIAGYALFYGVFSTFWTLPILWLEDLYVADSHRGRGLGLALMRDVARIAVERGCPRMDWVVLDWNRAAMDFYEELGAASHSGWQTYRLGDGKLRAFAAGGTVPARE